MIPRVIHYCWFGKKPLPKSVKKCIKSWQKFCPNYKIIRWDESNFDIHCNRFVEDAYNSKAWAFVSDYARLKIIYENGGFYLDTDVELLKNLDPLCKEHCFLPKQQRDHTVGTGLGFGAEKGHPTIKTILDFYGRISFDNNKRSELACPILTKRALKDIDLKKMNTSIYPPEYFDPIAPGNTRNLLSKKTYSIHHYSATWTNPKNRLKRKAITLVGEEKVLKLKKILGRI